MWRADTIKATQFQAGGRPKFPRIPNILRPMNLGQDKMKAKDPSNILCKEEHHADASARR